VALTLLAAMAPLARADSLTVVLENPNPTVVESATGTVVQFFGTVLNPSLTDTVPVLTSYLVNGFALVTDINFEGSTTATNNSSVLTGNLQDPVATPEPSSLELMLGGTGLLGLLMMRKRIPLGYQQPS